MPISQAGVFAGMNPASFNASDPIALFIIQAVIILCLCRLISIPLGYLRQPRVISEVIAGILLGPTVMGRIPNFQQSIFPSESLSYLNLISTLGLVFFLFQVGLEVDLRVIKRDWKKSATIAVVGMVIPFGLGCAVSLGLYNLQGDPTVPFGSFLLFLGVALSITAFPVLARILAELKLLKTQVGAITMAAGLVNDCTAWVLLALVVALLNSNEGLEALYVFLTAVGFSLFLIFLIGPLYYKLCVYTRFEKGPSPLLMTVTLMIALISAFVTDIIGIHPIFGGFLAGVIIPHEHDLPIKITEKIEDVVNIIFLPLYFTLSGLKTQIGLLNTGPVWGYVILVIFLACFGKIVGCTIAARLCGINNRESLTIGFLMNCKGLVELIVLNIGHDAGVLNDQVFAILVVMALITTFMTTPMVIYLYPEGSRNEVYGSSSTVDVLKDEEKWGTQIKTYRVITILNRFESLAPAMTLLQLFDTDKVKIHALRLLELTQRTSDVMKSKNEPHDPILKVLKTFANVIGINLKPHIEYAQDDIKSLSDCAMEIKADMVILPWISEEPNEIFYRAYQTINTCPVAVFVDNGFGVAQHATPRIIVVCEENDDSPLRFALKLQSLHKAEILVLGTHLKSQWATRDSVRRFMEGTEDELFISQTKSNVESKHVEQLRAKQIIDSSEPMSHDIIVISRRLQLDPDSSTHSALGLTAKELLAGHVSLLVVQ